jgi:hypothetical protein
VIDTIAIDAASVCAVVLERINNALDECGRPARAAYVAAGLVAWDDCCGMLVVAPERIFRTARFPIEGPDENNCYDGLIAVSLVALLVRCVPVLDDSGRPPTVEALGDAYAEVLADAGVVWNELSRWPEGWESSGQAQTFVGAEGGCIGVESRVTVGLDQELWCPPC